MKRLCKGLVAACVFAALVGQAIAQEAYSANVVGVIRKTIPAGCQVLMSIPLDMEGMDDTTATIAFTNLLFLSSCPINSSAQIWDPVDGHWISGSKKISGKWVGDITNCTLGAGQALFLKNGSSSTDLEIVYTGDAPADETIPVNLGVANQIQLIANPYPVSCKFTETSLASNAVVGSTVNFWVPDPSSPTKGGFVSGKKGLSKKWSSDVADYVVAPGEGFYYKPGNTATTSSQWVVDKPYEWSN